MAKVVMQLEALACPVCVKKIEAALAKADGVTDVEVSFSSSRARLNIDENAVTGDELKDIVTKLGYEVKSVKIS